MNYTIKKGIGTPAYLQLYTQLREDIVSGVYSAGMRLPSKRLLAGELGIAPVTAIHAYELLCDEGYAETRERSGVYVIYRENDLFNPAPGIRPAPPADSTDGAGSFPFSVLARTMRRVVTDYAETLLINTPPCGSTELREAIAAYLLRARGIRADAERIVIGSGAEYLYGLIAQLLRGRRFALEDPSYEKIRLVYTACGAETELLAMGAEGICSNALESSTASVLHVTPFHSYPSGVTASASKRREYIRWARARDAVIVEDDFDSEFSVSTKAEDTLYAIEGGEQVIYMNTFSHTIAPSLRMGYMLLPETLMEEFRRKLGFYSCTVPAFEQYVLAEFIRSGDFERHINRVRRRKRRAAKNNTEGNET